MTDTSPSSTPRFLEDPGLGSGTFVEWLVVDHLARRDAGLPVDFEALCNAHADLAPALRVELERWEAESVSDALQAVHQLGSLADPSPRAHDSAHPSGSTAGSARVDPGVGPPRAPTPGTRIGPYRLVRLLGQGGMGAVWEARDGTLDRVVALKLMRSDRVDERLMRFFEREARAAGRLAHPRLVAVHAAGVLDGVAYIAQELVGDGRTLGDRIHELADAPELPGEHDRDVAELVAAVAEGLATAHAAGVVHRDVKPSNIFIGSDGQPKLGDFGLAVLDDQSTIAQRFELLGSYAYMSPEQASPQGERLDARSDIFSLGAVLYELLTLRRPFHGDTPAEVLQRILYDDPPNPRRVRPGCHGDLAVIALRALEKRPAHRYATMADFAADLRRVLRHEPIRARPPGLLTRLVRWRQRHPALAAGLVLSLATVLAVCLWLRSDARLEGEQQRGLAAADAGALAKLLDDGERLGPPRVAEIPAFEAWLDAVDELVSRRGQHIARLAALRDGAQPWTDGGGVPAGGLAAFAPAWTEHQTLAAHIDALDALLHAGPDGLYADVHRRLDAARDFQSESPRDGRWREVWRDAQAAVGDRTTTPAYDGLELAVQEGLVPLGPDPDSGLWEFALAASGRLPERHEQTRRITPHADDAVVFVLVPGGSFVAGAQADDEHGANYDPGAHPLEGPPRRVEVEPFFLGKYELTQAQWTRLAGSNPASRRFWPFREPLDAHPVQFVDWYDCERLTRAYGLTLPTAEQSEYAARAGTRTPWWTGDDPETVPRMANLRVAVPGDPGGVDGHEATCRVGLFPANPWGLHDVLGNVAEWCSGPRLKPDNLSLKPLFGGHHAGDRSQARVSARRLQAATTRIESVGVRVARLLEFPDAAGMDSASSGVRAELPDRVLLAWLRREREAPQLATPAGLGELERWLDAARGLRSRLPEHLRAMESLRNSTSPGDAAMHATLTALVADAESFFEPLLDTGETPLEAVAAMHAEAVLTRQRAADHAARHGLWAQAVATIADVEASPAYAGLRLIPQRDLLPLGPDPRSGLWEFAHAAGGRPPVRDPTTGELDFDEDSGLVFVLIPGGTLRMGMQSADPDGENYGPFTYDDGREGPIHSIALDPFFLSKYELGREQWWRLERTRPSSGSLEAFDGHPGLAPLESVTKAHCETLLAAIGLTLPTEAQWEWACRAGTTTAWWTGADPSSLDGRVNMKDASYVAWAGVDDAGVAPDDGHPLQAPIDSMDPNPFGLHHMAGNVMEWCRDGYYHFDVPARPGDGYRGEPGIAGRSIVRGGSYEYASVTLMTSLRGQNPPERRAPVLGVRPARALER